MNKTICKIKLFVLALSLVTLCSCQTIGSYYKNIDDAREEKSFYKDADYLFSEDLDEAVIDFVIKDDVLHIVYIDIDNSIGGKMYRTKQCSSFSLEEALYTFNLYNEYDWTTTSNLSSFPISWCIVSKNFNPDDNLSFFEFTYENKSYHLCYIIDKK